MVYLNGGNYAKVHRVKSKFDGVEYAIKRSRTAVSSEAEAKRWQQVGPLRTRPHVLVRKMHGRTSPFLANPSTLGH